MFAKETKKLSFKVYEEQLFRELFEEQDFVTSKAKALYQSTPTYPIKTPCFHGRSLKSISLFFVLSLIGFSHQASGEVHALKNPNTQP